MDAVQVLRSIETSAAHNPLQAWEATEAVMRSLPRWHRLPTIEAARISAALMGAYMVVAERAHGETARRARERATVMAGILGATLFPDWQPV